MMFISETKYLKLYIIWFFYKVVCAEILFHSETEKETINMLGKAELVSEVLHE